MVLSSPVAARPEILIHVGLPKTASTFLQQGLFVDRQVGFASPWGAPSGPAVERFITTDAFAFSPEQTRAVFSEQIEQCRLEGVVPVLSQEMLAGDHVAGRYWGKEVAERLHAVFPEGKVLIMIREQRAMALSAFGQYIRNGGELDIHRFLKGHPTLPGFAPVCQAYFLEYHKLVEFYGELFGKDRVLVVPVELLRTNAEETTARILRFAGLPVSPPPKVADVNMNYGSATLEFHRHMNRYLPKPDYSTRNHPLAWRVAWKTLSLLDDRMIPSPVQQSQKQRWEEIIDELYTGRFRESNRRTGELSGLELGALGYET